MTNIAIILIKSGFFAALVIQIKIKFWSHLHVISKALDDSSKKYDNVILLGDFNNEPEQKNMSNFFNTYNMKNSVKQKTCFNYQIDRPVSI